MDFVSAIKLTTLCRVHDSKKLISVATSIWKSPAVLTYCLSNAENFNSGMALIQMENFMWQTKPNAMIMAAFCNPLPRS